MKTQLRLLLFMMLMWSFAACSSDDDSEPIDGSLLSFTVDRDTIRASGTDEARFTLTYNGKDVTSAAKIMEITTNTLLKGGIFTSEKTGEYTFVASYNSTNTGELKVRVVNELLFRKNVLLTSFTSTNCPNCPMMDDFLKTVLVQEPERANIISAHGPVKFEDPLQIDAIFFPLAEEFGVRDSPAVLLDQSELHVGMLDMSAITALTKVRGDVGIALETSTQGNKATIKVKVRASKDFDFPCALALVMLENNMIADQDRNGQIIVGYVHDHVARSYKTDLFGDPLPAAQFGKDKEYTRVFEVVYKPADYVEGVWNNVYPVVYVVNVKTNQVLNSQRVKLNGSVDFQYVEYQK